MSDTENKMNIYTDTLGTTLLSYTMGMDEGTRPSDDVIVDKWKTLVDKCKNVEGFAKNIVSPYDKGYVKSVVMAAGIPYQKQAIDALEWVVFINPFSYNLCFSRGVYVDDVLYICPLKKDGIFGLPQESIGVCYDYKEFLEKSDEDIEKDCLERREEILKHETTEIDNGKETGKA